MILIPEIFVNATLDSVITKSQIDIFFSSKSHVILEGKCYVTLKLQITLLRNFFKHLSDVHWLNFIISVSSVDSTDVNTSHLNGISSAKKKNWIP